MTERDDPYRDDVRLAQKALTAGNFSAALDSVSFVLAKAPTHPDALYVMAVAKRYTDDWEAADGALSQLIAEAPEYARAHQERGHLLRVQGKTNEALAAYQYAVQLNPSLSSSWQAIADLSQSHDQNAANAAATQVRHLSSLPKPLVAVMNHVAEGRILKAEELCRAFLQRLPTHTEGMRWLANIGVRLSVLDDAEFLLESAIELDPENVQLRLDYIEVLRKRQKHAKSLEQAELLHERDPHNPLFQSHLAVQSMQMDDYERAFKLFDAVLDKLPRDPATLTSKGHALKTFGKPEDAIKAYQAAVRSDHTHADAFYALANLKTYRFTDDETAIMRQHADAPGMPLRQRIQFHFALGKAFEDREAYGESFIHYDRGNALKRHQTRYDATMMEKEFEAQIETCTKDLFATKEGGHGAHDPIFIVGLPRAGSTLLEQILASHSQVDGTMELPNILSLAHRLRSNGPISATSAYPQTLHDLTTDERAAFGKTFIDETQVHRQGAPFFIDKMPNNFRHIGLIQLILPNAKIIDARREPMACCFSGFKQLFAEGQEFTYGLEEIGRYYRNYVELMAHWDAVLPGKVLRVQYEDVIEDLETQVRRILNHCGLPFEEACIDFHRTKRSVRTASSEQVRQPLYRSGVDQWRHFEGHLVPLKNALGPALQGYRK